MSLIVNALKCALGHGHSDSIPIRIINAEK